MSTSQWENHIYGVLRADCEGKQMSRPKIQCSLSSQILCADKNEYSPFTSLQFLHEQICRISGDDTRKIGCLNEIKCAWRIDSERLVIRKMGSTEPSIPSQN